MSIVTDNLIFSFKVHDLKLCINVSDIQEVNVMPELLPVPGQNRITIGMINLHGITAPVVALDKLLKIESNNEPKNLFITIITPNGPICFAVDELLGFDVLKDKQINILENTRSNLDTRYFKSVYCKENEMTPILKVDAFDNLERLSSKNDSI